jgi:hypothetical protein
MTLKDEAEVLAVLLERGVTDVADVVAWADALVAAEPDPHWAICDLALMGSSQPLDVVGALRALPLPGVADEAWVRDETVRRLASGLAADRRRADRVAEALWDLAMTERLPDGEVQHLALWALDALSLATEGVTPETRDDVIDALLAGLTESAATSGR